MCVIAVADARVFEVTIRVLNRNVTKELLNHSSPEFQDFSRQLLGEVKPELRHGALRGRPSKTPAHASPGAEPLLSDCTTPAQTPRDGISTT